MITRLRFMDTALKAAAGTALAAGGGLQLPRWAGAQQRNAALMTEGLPEGTIESAVLEALPGKRPLIKRSFRPPNYETPLGVFEHVVTPNDWFFVRYHLPNIPQVDAATWRLSVGGESVEKPLELSLADLKRDYEPVKITAVNQCSGNRRGLSNPHVAGVEWGYGAMGNADWKGARLKDVLAKAGLKKDALEVVSNGTDTAALEKTPDFVKSLPMWKALDENTLLAYEMNSDPLPHWNGFPVRLVVPGWTGTYWMKHIVSLNVVSQPFTGFWMKAAYRIPKGKFPVVDRFISQETDVNTPITEMVVNSLITQPIPDAHARAGEMVEVRGIAWDGGYGIQAVDVSIDGGHSWEDAKLQPDLGRFSFRQFLYRFKAPKRGGLTIMSKATNRLGQTQVSDAIFNPAGYHHNVINKRQIVIT